MTAKRTVASVRGADLSGFVSAANNAGIALCDIKKDGDELTFCCGGKDEKKLRAFAARRGLYFEVKNRRDFRFYARALLRHIGAATALVVAMASFVASRFFVFSVSVEGVSADSAARIVEALEEAGIDKITAKSGIDLSKVEEIAVGADENLASAEAYIDGVRLVVSVRRQLPEPVPEEENGKIISSVDAIVTRVEVSGGTALVKAGDTVRKGQTLIDDVIIVGDPADPEHEEIETAAKGDVYGRVWYTERLTIPVYRTEYLRTGREFESTALLVRGKTVLGAKSDHGFADWESVSSRTDVKAIVPFTLVTTKYYELEAVTVETDEVYVQEQVYGAFARLTASLDESAVVRSSYKSQKKVDNYIIIILYYEVEQLIGCREA